MAIFHSNITFMAIFHTALKTFPSKILRETSYRVITVSDISEEFSIDIYPNGVAIALVRSNFCLYSVTGRDCLGRLKLFLVEEGGKP